MQWYYDYLYVSEQVFLKLVVVIYGRCRQQSVKNVNINILELKNASGTQFLEIIM